MEYDALPDEYLSKGERLVAFTLLGVCLVILIGMLMAPGVFWDDFFEPVVWEPITRDASAVGDAGYTPMNTAIYATTLLACVVVNSAIMRFRSAPLAMQ